MTPPDDLVRLRHLRDAAEKALHFADGNGRQDLEDDELLRLALTKLVEIVGEAAKQAARRPGSNTPRSRGPRLQGCEIVSSTITSTSISTSFGSQSPRTCRSFSTSCRHGSSPRDADLPCARHLDPW